VESIEFNNNIFSKWGKTHKIMLGIVFSDSKDILNVDKLIINYSYIEYKLAIGKIKQMDDRSYREGHPPYCTCVECLEKNNKNQKKMIQFSIKKPIILLLIFLVVISLILAIFI